LYSGNVIVVAFVFDERPAFVFLVVFVIVVGVGLQNLVDFEGVVVGAEA
jgi:hypothetical protein